MGCGASSTASASKEKNETTREEPSRVEAHELSAGTATASPRSSNRAQAGDDVRVASVVPRDDRSATRKEKQVPVAAVAKPTQQQVPSHQGAFQPLTFGGYEEMLKQMRAEQRKTVEPDLATTSGTNEVRSESQEIAIVTPPKEFHAPYSPSQAPSSKQQSTQPPVVQHHGAFQPLTFGGYEEMLKQMRAEQGK